MVQHGIENGVGERQSGGTHVNGGYDNPKPTYALQHLVTFKVRNESEIRNPMEKLKMLFELDKTGGIWPQKMYMCFSGQWLLMLDSDMKEIENFPGALITEPTAFISEDPLETFNNILIFTVRGASLGNTEMHIFQVSDVSAVFMVEDLKLLSSGNTITVDRNKSPIKLPNSEKSAQNGMDQYGIAVAAAEVASEKNAQDREQTERDILVINHCFEDIERFISRLQYAAESLRELELRKNEHNPHGEGLLVLRSRPPIESEFSDIYAKVKLALNYVYKLKYHFTSPTEPITNLFISLHTIVDICNEVHVGSNIAENVINPLLKRETVTFLTSSLNTKDLDFWQSLGINWTRPKEHFKDHKGSYHPIFYDDWSPDWVVDEEVAYVPPAIKKDLSLQNPNSNTVWLSRLESRNVKIAEVIYNKTGSNSKELNVAKGEYIEIIDDSRNWWKARNSAGSIGYVPNTVLLPYNFEPNSNLSGRDTDSLSSSIEPDHINQNHNNGNGNDNFLYRNTMSALPQPTESDFQEQAQLQLPQNPQKPAMPRSYSMPIVPIPPPLPPPSDSQPSTPSGTMKRNMAAAGTIAAMRARNDFDDEALMLQGTINDELKYTLLQRERRRDLEILTTPQIYINQHSTPKEVEEWLRGKGFSDIIIMKLRRLNGEELFALSAHVLEGYFGQNESRRLISQIVLQRNICEYKTIRSTELSAKLAKVRQKVDQKASDHNEIF